MVSESQIRDTLEEIDKLRADVKLCRDMMSHWMGHDGELVVIAPVVVRRRWRSPQTTHSERVMPTAEMRIFFDWLSERARQRSAEADTLAATLTERKD
jgi:hypothetical protein